MKKFLEYEDSRLLCHHTYDEDPRKLSFYMHAHERMELFYLISGDLDYIVEGTQYTVQPGDIMIMHSAEVHRPMIHPGKPYERISIQFDASLLDTLDPKKRLLMPFRDRALGQLNQYPMAGWPQDLFQPCFAHFDDYAGGDLCRVNIISTLLQALISISDQFENTSPVEKYPHDNSIASQLITTINQNLFQPISLSGISQQFYLSESQINRIFKRATGASVGKYIRAKRLLAAREMILAGTPATVAAENCCFQDYSTFYRAYVDHFNIPPSETRARQEMP